MVAEDRHCASVAVETGHRQKKDERRDEGSKASNGVVGCAWGSEEPSLGGHRPLDRQDEEGLFRIERRDWLTGAAMEQMLG